MTLLPGVDLAEVLKSWKGFTSREINRRQGTTGQSLWQERYFDRFIRDWTHFGRVVRYMRRNPEMAGLSEGEALLWEGPWAKGC